MEILILHLIGDYLTQSDWMANNKTSKWFPALVHATIYSLPFLLLTRSIPALLFIWGTHLLIDHYRLAKYVCWAKNFIAPPSVVNEPHCDEEYCFVSKRAERFKWENCKATGYPSDVPPWMAVWLMIIADNTLHLVCNYSAVRWF